MYMTMRNKILIGIGAVIGLGIVWWLASPLFITNRVSEELPVATTSFAPIVSSEVVATPSVETIAQGTFTGFDSLHRASGNARLIRTNGKAYIRFEEDFTVTNGPDLFVHLGKNGKYDAEVNLGKLKGNEGSQNYEIPATINLDEYSEVWVWCRAFSVPFGKAVLVDN